MISRRLSAVLAIALFLAFGVGPSYAQATRTWVSGVGDDANPCSRTAPCKTFAGAIAKTAAGGEISVLDPGGFGAVTITKSISLVNDYSGEAGILASGTNGVTVNAGPNDIVILRGLVIDGAPPGTPGLNGVRFLAGAALHIQKCLIKNFWASTAGNGNGILFAPTAVGSELYIQDTIISDNGNPTSAVAGEGILIQPTGSGSANVVINRTQVENNRGGIRADSTTGSGTISVLIRDSVVGGTTFSGIVGASAAASGVAVNIMVDNVGIVGNNNGLNANGSVVTIRVANSTISNNASAVATSNSGQVLSYKNNRIDGNTNNNTPLPMVGLN